MNILFPIAGQGSRFIEAGIDQPKPLVKVAGKSLLEHAIRTLNLEGQYIFVAMRYENEKYNQEIQETILNLKPDSIILTISKPTEGSAQTCLLAEDCINNDTPLLITNCDQYLNWRSEDFIVHIQKENPDGCVSLYDHEDVVVGQPSKYAFVDLDSNGYAKKFEEKFAISKFSLNGIHYWRYGKDFVSSVKQMINDNVRVNGEFYFSPSYNYLIDQGKRITTYHMSKDEYYSLGSPQEINKNKNNIK
jgi:dTDP-glucose pyrophosphorylase